MDQRPATGDSHPRRARYHLPRPSGQQPETFTSPPCRATAGTGQQRKHYSARYHLPWTNGQQPETAIRAVLGITCRGPAVSNRRHLLPRRAVPRSGEKKTVKRTKCFTPQVLGLSSTKAAATAGRYATAVAHTLPCQAYAPVLPARLTSGYVERRLTHRREAAEAMLAVLSSDVGHQTTIGLLLRAEVRTWPKLTTRHGTDYVMTGSFSIVLFRTAFISVPLDFCNKFQSFVIQTKYYMFYHF